MSKLFTTFQERFTDWLTAPWTTSLQLSLWTLLVAIFLTIPLAVYLNSQKKRRTGYYKLRVSSRPFPQWPCWVSSFPFHGDWNLTGPYSSSHLCDFPDFENTITALNGIDPSLEEAGLLLE